MASAASPSSSPDPILRSTSVTSQHSVSSLQTQRSADINEVAQEKIEAGAAKQGVSLSGRGSPTPSARSSTMTARVAQDHFTREELTAIKEANTNVLNQYFAAPQNKYLDLEGEKLILRDLNPRSPQSNIVIDYSDQNFRAHRFPIVCSQARAQQIESAVTQLIYRTPEKILPLQDIKAQEFAEQLATISSDMDQIFEQVHSLITNPKQLKKQAATLAPLAEAMDRNKRALDAIKTGLTQLKHPLDNVQRVQQEYTSLKTTLDYAQLALTMGEAPAKPQGLEDNGLTFMTLAAECARNPNKVLYFDQNGQPKVFDMSHLSPTVQKEFTRTMSFKATSPQGLNETFAIKLPAHLTTKQAEHIHGLLAFANATTRKTKVSFSTLVASAPGVRSTQPFTFAEYSDPTKLTGLWNTLGHATRAHPIPFRAFDMNVDRFDNIPCPARNALPNLHGNVVGEGLTQRHLIATQAPKLESRAAFWDKAILPNGSLIVDLTTEKDRAPAGGVTEYGPNTIGETLSYGACNVTRLPVKEPETPPFQSYSYRVSQEDKRRHIERLRYPLWLDFQGIPPADLYALVNKIDEHEKTHPGAPIVIHCRAGVGRTGTLTAAMILFERFSAGSLNRANFIDELSHIILTLREQRGPDCVQKPDQLQSLLQFGEYLFRLPPK